MRNEKDNKLIAEFMGWTIEKGMENIENPFYNWADGWNMTRPSEMKFHASWDWLMPVVEMIKDLGYLVELTSRPKQSTKLSGCRIHKGDFKYEWTNFDGSLFTSTYEAIIQFITYYNQQPK